MLISVIVLTILSLSVLFMLFRRDQKYLKSRIQETASEDLKKHLNVKHEGATFDAELQVSQQKMTKSIDIIRKLNGL